MTSEKTLNLNGFTFSELFHSEGLNRLDQTFLTYLKKRDEKLYLSLISYRDPSHSLTGNEVSELLILSAVVLEDFLASLFAIEDALSISQAKTTSYNPISVFKKYFVLKRAKRELARVETFPSFDELNQWLTLELKKVPLTAFDNELAVALLGNHYLQRQESYTEEIEQLVKWCARALTSSEGKIFISNWKSMQIPERVDHSNLVQTVLFEKNNYPYLTAPPTSFRLRDGFKLTDPRMNAREVQDEVNYCIYCHDHDGDFCSKGFPVKKGDPLQGFKKNPLAVTLTGCPLEEKISEMQYLKKDGHTLAALAMVMVDNPMCPATGHRICNDCMKSCIYQKQDPVNVPQIETRVLTDVLDLPWGVEIYDLLTRWNPLRQTQWVMKPYNGLKVMVAGMGPAGFTLAHHLLLEGFAVVGFDGLKIEPLPSHLIKQPIYQFANLKESLDERLMAGFGGVAEYGITSRWDKNFLKLIYLTLMRRPYFQVFGSVRFGGTVTVEDAWEMGFDHFVVAVGAGLPKALSIPESLAPGMRQANDFLMALQLGNAAKSSSLTNLQVRLPALVIGGGLTGVDAATEIQAYYPKQVEKILKRYERLADEYGDEHILKALDENARQILNEYLTHGRIVRQERERAKREGREPDFLKLIHEWGGVTIAYRRTLQESPAYIHNHEELKKALEEGIYYAEGLEPKEVSLDDAGHVKALICYKRKPISKTNEWIATDEEVKLPARSILVATGTQPNTAYEFEYKGTFNRLNLQYQHYEDREGSLAVAHGVKHCKDPEFGPFTSYTKGEKRVSLIGDTHPVFHGSVVKAIASGMRTYPKILKILKKKLKHLGNEDEYRQFRQRMDHLFRSRVTSISRKTKNIIELTIQSPVALKHFKPGQFYRLQNFESLSLQVNQTLLQMEPLALITAEHHLAHETLTFTVTENSATAKLCATLKVGDEVSLMGPTGVRAKIPTEHETVLVIGMQVSIPFLRCYGSALRALHNHVIYLGVFQDKDEVYCQKAIENAADVIIWLIQHGDLISVNRQEDEAVKGDDMIATLINYAKQSKKVPLADVDRIFVVGNTELLRRFQTKRESVLKPFFPKNPKVYGSVYGNMQCMLKGVCAQCLQWQIDPETGHRTKAVFACSWQDQPLEIIDLEHVEARLQQNNLHEHLSDLWVEYLFSRYDVPRI